MAARQPRQPALCTAPPSRSAARRPSKVQSVSDPDVHFQTTADKDGHYSFREVPDGEYSLEARATGLVAVRYSPIRVKFPLPVQKDFVLDIAPGHEGGIQIQADVVGALAQSGRTLAHAKVCLSQESRESCAETNGIGQYYLSVPPGIYVVAISIDGNTLWKGRLELPRAGEYRDKLQLNQQTPK